MGRIGRMLTAHASRAGPPDEPAYTHRQVAFRFFPVRRRSRRALATAAMLSVFAVSASATPVTGKLSVRGAVAFSATTIDFLPAGGGTGGFVVGDAATLSGDFVALAGTAGSLSDLTFGSFPTTFATFAANPDIVFKITSIGPGVFASAACTAAPAAGQTCSPTGSPFDLVNTTAGCTLTFIVSGTVTRVSTGEITDFAGTFTTQLAGSSYQAFLAAVASGTVDAEYSADFNVTAPPP
jgi:hypothetical protein